MWHDWGFGGSNDLKVMQGRPFLYKSKCAIDKMGLRERSIQYKGLAGTPSLIYLHAFTRSPRKGTTMHCAKRICGQAAPHSRGRFLRHDRRWHPQSARPPLFSPQRINLLDSAPAALLMEGKRAMYEQNACATSRALAGRQERPIFFIPLACKNPKPNYLSA